MPNGYRRGGSYTRNGRTYYRRGTQIKPRHALYAGAAAGIAITAATGGALIGSPVLIGLGVCGVLGYLTFNNRRRLRPLGRKMQRWAGKRYAKRNTRPVLVARAPAKVPVYQPRRVR